MKKLALITGATSGIGKACAEKFAEAGYNLIITGRRKERLDEIAGSLSSNYNINVLPLSFDVRERETVSKQIEQITKEWTSIDVLINNAGLALGRDSFEDADIDDWDVMLQTNVNGLLYVSKAVLPFMISQRKGHIINIGSIAGKEVYENGNVYCASKAAVDSITKSMRIDLLKYGIKVTGIHPGAVETEFSIVRFKSDKKKANAAYIGYKPLTANDIADVVLYCSSLPEHVCINDLVITCTQQANAIYFHKNP